MSNFWSSARRWLPGVIISLVIIVLLAATVDWSSVAYAFASIDWRYLFLHAGLYFASVSARAAASRVLLEDRPTFGQSFLAMMQGYLLNNILPFRLGELGRAYLLGRQTGQGTFFTVPAILIERAYDLALAALIVIATLPSILGDVSWARPVAYATLAIVSLGLLSLFFVARFRVALRSFADRAAGRLAFVQKHILPRLDQFLDGLAVLTSLKRFLLSLTLMVISWMLAIGNQWALLTGFIKGVPLLYSTFALGISSFGGAIPSAPANLGVFEGSIVAALALVGISSGVALAFAVTHHLAHLLYSGIFGLIGFSRQGESLISVYDRLLKKGE
jgi:uncharacterized protein (TIRG00374 family)